MIAILKGKFKTFDTSIYTNGQDFTTGKIDVWIDAKSIATDDKTGDKHLISPIL